ncbi:MAG TPA: alpha/beta hydrolase-fold protein, partial [Puia sp.]|nr:alpha/beta hydrolase-fold protein [Puia sp.]
ESIPLQRTVEIDLYSPRQRENQEGGRLLLINDGQDLGKLGLEKILDTLYDNHSIHPLICVGIHAGAERKLEYGTATILDYKGRGSKANKYTLFIFEELLPFLRAHYSRGGFIEKAFAGFSLGGLSALDIVWNHPHEFNRVGVFSGSLWWRTKDKQDATYNDDTDRIMHQLIRAGSYYPWLKFFLECGAADEEDDRNSNGIIDSIDDTLDLIKELEAKGYHRPNDIQYLEIEDGKHDIATWARAMPEFLHWGWSRE